MPTRCNRGFYCRSYCLLSMFRAPLCPSAGAQEYYTVVAACGISCCGFQVAGLVWSWGLCVRFAGCCSELLMMGLVVPETCWASNKICNKNLCCIYLAFYFHIWFSISLYAAVSWIIGEFWQRFGRKQLRPSLSTSPAFSLPDWEKLRKPLENSLLGGRCSNRARSRIKPGISIATLTCPVNYDLWEAILHPPLHISFPPPPPALDLLTPLPL